MKRVAWAGVLLLGTMAWGVDDQKLADDALWGLPAAVESVEGVKTLAMVQFSYEAGITAKNVEEKVVRLLTRRGRFKIVDRRALETLLEEQKLSMSGLTQESDLRKVGQLVNVDAFMFGKVTRGLDKLVVNLEIRDVASSAVVWSEELVGENPDQAAFGMGIRMGTFGMTSKTYVSGGPGVNEFANLQSNAQGSYIAFLLHYVQRFGWTKAFSFGADAIFSRGDWTSARFDQGVLSDTFLLYQASTFRDWNLTLIPLLRFHPAYLFGARADILVLYGGVGFSGDYFGLEGTFRYRKADGSADSGEIKYSRVDLYPGNVAWKVGAEMRLTQNLSMFVEAYHLPGVTARYDDVESRIAPQVSLDSGIFYGFGAKYYGLNF